MLQVMETEKYRMLPVSDLLAIVLGKDAKDVEIGADMLFEPNALYCSVKELSDKTNLSKGNAKKLLALAELMKRRKPHKEKVLITSSKDIYNYVHEDFEGLDHEELFVLFLNKANYVIQQVRFSIGSYVNSIYDVRQILRKALELKATAMVMQHNHPSGCLVPSHCDDYITKNLLLAGKCMDIQLLDHIIISNEGYYSYEDNKGLESLLK